MRRRHTPSSAGASTDSPPFGARLSRALLGLPLRCSDTRFSYPRTSPNTIATAFAGLALLDAYELADAPDALEMAIGAGEFFLRRVPQTRAEPGAYFGYLPGDSTPIHNANMLVAALLARLASLSGRNDFAQAAQAALEYTIGRQRPDGSWPYGRSGISSGSTAFTLGMCWTPWSPVSRQTSEETPRSVRGSGVSAITSQH